jgi:hypothetical protein
MKTGVNENDIESSIWLGSAGCFLFVTAILIAFGLSWMAWIGAPLGLFDPQGPYVLSRGKDHRSFVGPGLWWLSWAIALTTLLAGLSFLLAAGFSASGTFGKSGETNFKWWTLGTFGLGLVSALIGTIASAFSGH